MFGGRWANVVRLQLIHISFEYNFTFTCNEKKKYFFISSVAFHLISLLASQLCLACLLGILQVLFRIMHAIDGTCNEKIFSSIGVYASEWASLKCWIMCENIFVVMKLVKETAFNECVFAPRRLFACVICWCEKTS